jgi:pilus assembly protein CpaE
MSGPVVLLAGFGEPDPIAAVLNRAGFETVVPGTAAGDASDLPDLAILDCDGPADLVGRVFARLHGEIPVPTILLFSDEPPEIITTSLASDEFAMKPQPPEGLVFRLQAMTIRATQEHASGHGVSAEPMAGEARVIGVFAPKGGVGKTTIAVNVAVALRQQSRGRVLLLDADVGMGNVTSVIAVSDSRGLTDLADSDPELWTAEAFEHLAVTHEPTGLRVMTWGSHPSDADRIGPDLLIAAVRWARSAHDLVIIDTHPGYDDRTMAMLTASTEILLVVTPEVGALRNTAQFLELAEDIGLSTSIRVIANRANHGVAISEMATALGVPVAATVISSGPRAVQAANEGQPLVTRFPSERVSNDLHAVARLVAGPAASPSTEESRRRFALPSFQRASA